MELARSRGTLARGGAHAQRHTIHRAASLGSHQAERARMSPMAYPMVKKAAAIVPSHTIGA